jgi:hypothetical protein
MSTIPRIIELENGGGFARHQPRFRGSERDRRKLTLPEPMDRWLTMHDPDPDNNEWRVAILAQLKRFVVGRQVDDCYFIKRVADYRRGYLSFSANVWAIGIRFHPQYRFFGMFPVPDWFIIFHRQARDVLDSPDKWHIEIDKCADAWDAAFPGRHPFTGLIFSHYITQNSEHCDERWYPV